MTEIWFVSYFFQNNIFFPANCYVNIAHATFGKIAHPLQQRHIVYIICWRCSVIYLSPSCSAWERQTGESKFWGHSVGMASAENPLSEMGIKGFLEGPNNSIRPLALGFELATFWSEVQSHNLLDHIPPPKQQEGLSDLQYFFSIMG